MFVESLWDALQVRSSGPHISGRRTEAPTTYRRKMFHSGRDV